MSRDHALSFEAVKVAMRQTKEGYAVTLVVHPNDVPSELFSDPVGQRYVVALVAVDENEQPKVRNRSDGAEAVKYAALLCKEPEFWSYLQNHSRRAVIVKCEESAADILRETLGIDSRSEIGSDLGVRERFEQLAQDYREWAGIE